MESALKNYLDKCQTIFSAHHSKLTKVIHLSGKKELTKDIRQFFESAIKDAENTPEFEAFFKALKSGPLATDLERLSKDKEKRKKPGKALDVDKYRDDTARRAAQSFFRNTGTYLHLWQNSDLDKFGLINILDDYSRKRASELIRLFVFDGFVLYHDRKRLNNITLPVGKFRKYTEKELGNIFGLPQSSWHGIVKDEIVKNAAVWYILTVQERVEYRGMGGLWISGRLVYSFDWAEIETTRKESDVGLIGPIFLCIGEDANLAVEIRIRTNPFECFPVNQKIRNDYLPWDSYDDEGEPQPRFYVKDVGEDGKKLRRIFEIWQTVNDLDRNGFLRYPTEAYVRSVMNLHTSWESLLETLVGFVTVIESLLTPGTRQDLAHKTSSRGAALLSTDPKQRINLFEILDGFYKMRSQIVHEGRTDKEDPLELKSMISHSLTEISRQVFLRYICMLDLGLKDELPEWVLPDPKKLSSRSGRPMAISRIFDCLVLNPNLTEILEQKMTEWGIYENWYRKAGLHLAQKSPSG